MVKERIFIKETFLSEELSKELNIILFTIDTLRADHLECYGYKQIKTPNINRLAEEGIKFENFVAQAPLTLPSHCSILTGTYPLYHGVRDNGAFYLDQKNVTLAEVLKEKAYRTGAFIGAFVLDSRWGLDQGFDYYFDNFDLTKYKRISLDAVQRRGDEVLKETRRWIEENSKNKFFAWIHLYDPHTPYDPPEPFKSQYQGKKFGLYDGEIAYVDYLIGEFLQFLKSYNLLEKTLIILTADHGESLGEHKESAHGFFIYEAVIRIPLIIRLPQNQKLKNVTILSQAQSIDLMPTILELVGTSIPSQVQGKSLLPLIISKPLRQEPAYSETFYPRYHYGWSELRSLRQDNLKLIVAPRPELYDLSLDPTEINNLYWVKKSVAKKMERELEKLIKRYSNPEAEKAFIENLDHESLVKLQTLGYIGSFHNLMKEKKGKTGRPLADPKDRIEVYNEIKLTQFLVSEEKLDLAERKIRQVLKEDPSILEARYLLGYLLAKQKRYDEAIKEFQAALEVEPEYYEAIFGLSLAYKENNQFHEAILGFKRMIDLNPRDTKPYIHLADIYQDQGNMEEALKQIQAAVAIDPESRYLHNRLGACYLALKRYEEAEKEIKLALSMERSQPLMNAHFNLALLHEARGQIEEAIAEYRKEQEISPFNWRPDFNLGLIFLKRKELSSAEKEFRSCLEKNENYGPAYIFLAKVLMDRGIALEEAAEKALYGLRLNPDLPSQILGHFVLADIYNRLGQPAKANFHLLQAHQLQSNKN
ncbi:MAG: sulfatase-like hydrolase/transferase [Candidatus Aminicenantes bacterium]|nr:sulfatase-like hydrolase/transferase [Candidatus Aminicenantes bacterium]